MVFPLCDGNSVANGEIPFTFLLNFMRKPGGLQPNVLDVVDDLRKLEAEGLRDVIVVCRGRGREINRALLGIVVEVGKRIYDVMPCLGKVEKVRFEIRALYRGSLESSCLNKVSLYNSVRKNDNGPLLLNDLLDRPRMKLCNACSRSPIASDFPDNLYLWKGTRTDTCPLKRERDLDSGT